MVLCSDVGISFALLTILIMDLLLVYVLSKAFDKMNHYALLVKLMDANLPSEILNILKQ